MTSNDLCTVLLPVYNNEDDIISAIQSIIDQNYKSWELIIIDDCSTDGTYENIQEFIVNNPDYPIQLLRNKKNCGVYVSMNEGLKRSNGTYISLINSDDTYHADILVESINCLERDTKLVAVMSKYQRDTKIIYAPVTLVYRKQIIDEIGYYDSVRFAADSEFHERIIKKYGNDKIKLINKILYYAKQRENSLTTSNVTGILGTGQKPRQEYVNNYRKWHRKLNLYMGYPQNDRPFPVSSIMLS